MALHCLALYRVSSCGGGSEKLLLLTMLLLEILTGYPASQQSPSPLLSNQGNLMKSEIISSQLNKIHSPYCGLQGYVYPCVLSMHHPLLHPPPDTCLSLLFLNHARFAPASGLLHMMFPLSGMFFFQMSPWLARPHQPGASSNAAFQDHTIRSNCSSPDSTFTCLMVPQAPSTLGRYFLVYLMSPPTQCKRLCFLFRTER